MERILEAIAAILKDWVSLALIGLGITFSPSAYIGGLFLAFAGAAIARAWEKDKAEKSGIQLPKESYTRFSLIVLTAFFVSTLVSICINAYFPNWSIQVCMAASGFASRKVVILALSVADNLSQKGDVLADRIADRVLPEKKDG